MATEAMKLLLDGGNPLVGRLMTYDSMSMKFQEFKVNPDQDCLICGTAPQLTQLLQTMRLTQTLASYPFLDQKLRPRI